MVNVCLLQTLTNLRVGEKVTIILQLDNLNETYSYQIDHLHSFDLKIIRSRLGT